MKLLIVTQYFPPEMGAPQARLFELATRLQQKGHTVTILTAMPNYPTGKVFKGYRWKLRRTEEMQGLRVIRTCIYPSNSSHALPRLLCYASFVISSLVLGIWGLGRQDVVLFESPPLFMVPTGLLIGWLARGRIVMNVSDIWPDILVRMGHGQDGIFMKAMFWLERFGYRHSDAVALTNPGAMAQIRERFPDVATTVISNGVDTKLFRPELRSEEIRASLGAGPGDFLAGYCGLHGLAQGLEAVLLAAGQLQDQPRIKFVMIGDGPVKEKLVAMAREMKLTNVTFFSHRPKKEMPAVLASCDASLVPLLARLPGTMPSKVYEAMSAGVPVVVAKGCEGEALVNQFDVGRAFEPMDGQDLAKAILDLASHPEKVQAIRANCIHLAQRFDRGVIAERTERTLCALAEGAPLPEVAW